MEKSAKMNYITLVYGEEKEISEVDLDLHKAFNLGNERYDYIYKRRKPRGWAGEADPIAIDRVIAVLENMKKKGCDYVEIMNHTDHHGYVFNGLKINKSTPDEIEEFEKNKEESARIRGQMLALRNEFDSLNKKLEKLENT